MKWTFLVLYSYLLDIWICVQEKPQLVHIFPTQFQFSLDNRVLANQLMYWIQDSTSSFTYSFTYYLGKSKGREE